MKTSAQFSSRYGPDDEHGEEKETLYKNLVYLDRELIWLNPSLVIAYSFATKRGAESGSILWLFTSSEAEIKALITVRLIWSLNGSVNAEVARLPAPSRLRYYHITEHIVTCTYVKFPTYIREK